jgi:hypothetical protein
VFFLFNNKNMKKIRQWLTYSRLIRKKKKDLAQLDCDIKFYEQYFKARELPKKISALRANLSKEQKKEDDKKDSMKINDIAYDIAQDEALQKNFDAMLKTAVDIECYINLLIAWRKNI